MLKVRSRKSPVFSPFSNDSSASTSSVWMKMCLTAPQSAL